MAKKVTKIVKNAPAIVLSPAESEPTLVSDKISGKLRAVQQLLLQGSYPGSYAIMHVEAHKLLEAIALGYEALEKEEGANHESKKDEPET